MRQYIVVSSIPGNIDFQQTKKGFYITDIVSHVSEYVTASLQFPPNTQRYNSLYTMYLLTKLLFIDRQQRELYQHFPINDFTECWIKCNFMCHTCVTVVHYVVREILVYLYGLCFVVLITSCRSLLSVLIISLTDVFL